MLGLSKKIRMQCAHHYCPETREVSMSIWRLHNIVSHEEWSRHRHRCSLGRGLHDAAKRPNAHYKSQTNSKHSGQVMRERARPRGTLSADSVIQSFLTEIKKGYNVQHSMAQKSGFGLIWQFTGGEKGRGKQQNHLLVSMRSFSGAAWIDTYNRWSNKAPFRHMCCFVFMQW